MINRPQFHNPSTGTATLTGPASDGTNTIIGRTTTTPLTASENFG